MVDRRPKLLFDAILAAEAAISFVAQVDAAQYRSDLLRRSAVERQLEILGEACARLAKEEAKLFEHLPDARLAIGLRNRIIHGYDGIDDETVYRTVVDDLPGFVLALRARLADLSAS
jgi:uncharacterized protein with HEPN domain